MFGQLPGETPYDLRFQLAGFPVRISWTFWLMAVVLGYELVRSIDMAFVNSPLGSPGVPVLLLIWAGCIMLSILIHELGHTLAFRWYGVQSHVLLYHFGGLAIPSGYQSGGRSSGYLAPTASLLISAAGPLAQIGSAALLVVVVAAMGYRVEVLSWLPGPLAGWTSSLGGRPLGNAVSFAMVNFYVLPSIFWGLLNLLPVLPLDGGRIAEALLAMLGYGRQIAYQLSLVTAALVAIYAFQSGQMFLAVFFVWMGIDAYQAMQGGGRWS